MGESYNGVFHMAAKGWITLQCQLHIKIDATQHKKTRNTF